MEGVGHEVTDQGARASWSSQAMRGLPGSRSRGRPAEGGRFGDESADPADGRDELGHGVLGGHRIVQDGGVEGPSGRALEHPGLGDHRSDGVEDPLGGRRGRSLLRHSVSTAGGTPRR